jgi:hypothetical protein
MAGQSTFTLPRLAKASPGMCHVCKKLRVKTGSVNSQTLAKSATQSRGQSGFQKSLSGDAADQCSVKVKTLI